RRGIAPSPSGHTGALPGTPGRPPDAGRPGGGRRGTRPGWPRECRYRSWRTPASCLCSPPLALAEHSPNSVRLSDTSYRCCGSIIYSICIEYLILLLEISYLISKCIKTKSVEWEFMRKEMSVN